MSFIRMGEDGRLFSYAPDAPILIEKAMQFMREAAETLVRTYSEGLDSAADQYLNELHKNWFRLTEHEREEIYEILERIA